MAPKTTPHSTGGRNNCVRAAVKMPRAGGSPGASIGCSSKKQGSRLLALRSSVSRCKPSHSCAESGALAGMVHQRDRSSSVVGWRPGGLGQAECSGSGCCWALRPARKVRMANWNWSSGELRANSGASWTCGGNSLGTRRRRRPTCGARTRRWPAGWCRPGRPPGRRTHDVGQQRIDGADHGLDGEPRRPQDVVDRIAEAQPVRARPGCWRALRRR